MKAGSIGVLAPLGGLADSIADRIVRGRLARGKEHPIRWPERLGWPNAPRPEGRLIWVHAASVGESAAVLPLLPRLAEEGGAEILLTTGTVSSAAFVETRLGPGVRHHFAPVDAPGAGRRFLDHWRPDLGVLVESELWPGLITKSRARGLPLVLINGRMSERSFGRWRLLGGLARSMLTKIALVAAQSESDADRFSRLGAPRVETTGNLKFDGPPPSADPQTLDVLRAAIGARPAFGAASTHAGEEEKVLEAHRALAEAMPELLLLLAPRHPPRAAEVIALCAAKGLTVARRSLGETPKPETDVLLFDTIGELGLLYRLAPVSFVGGSLIPHGGQNPLEPAKLRSVVLHGPHVRNFRDVYRMLDEDGAAVLVSDSAGLAAAVKKRLLDPALASQEAERAFALVARSQGAAERTIDALSPFLKKLKA